MAVCRNITISKGHTYSSEIRWETTPIVRVAISAITRPLGSAVIATTTPHGLTDGWRVAIVNVAQPREINADDPNNIKAGEYYPATVTGQKTVELNTLNIGDLRAYTTDGFIQYNTPVDLSGITLRFRLRYKKGGKILASNLVADAPLNILVASTDVAANKITIAFPSTATELLAGKTGWYDVEAVSADATPVVTQLVYGKVTVEKE